MNALAVACQSMAWMGICLGTYFAFRVLYLRLTRFWLNPVLWATITVTTAITIAGHPRATFAAETQPLVWLLGPAVVAMARPIWLQSRLIVTNWRMFAAVVGVSLAISVGTVIVLPPLLGADMARALSVKSVTAAVALGVAQRTDLVREFVVVGVMVSGLFGMVLGPALLALCGIKGDRPEVGAALGCASHGLGTARAYEIGHTAGAFASVTMGLSAMAFGLLLPVLLPRL